LTSSRTKPIIAVDIDDVIAAHAQAFVDYSNQKFGTHLTIDDYQDHWGEIWKTDHTVTQPRALEYHTSGYMAGYGIIEGAHEALRQLKDRYKLVVITSRRKSVDQLTLDWIDEYYPDTFDSIVFAGFFDNPTKDSLNMTKAELVKQAGADFLIDDQLKHCAAAAKAGIRALLFGDYAWNQAAELPVGVTRVENWGRVIEYFNKEEALTELKTHA